LHTFADGLPGLRSPAAAHRNWASKLAADLDHANHVFARLGNDNAQRADQINTGVCGI